MSIIADLSQIVLDFINSAGYFGIFLAMFMEGIITPIPSEMIVPFGGYLAYLGKMQIWAVVLVATLGSTAGSTVSYFLAQKLGRPVLLRFGRYIGIDEDTVTRSENFFAKRGKFSVLFGHMVPGIRSIISYPAGICKMDIKVFLVFTFIGGLVWNSVLATVGFYLGDQWMTFWHSLEGWDLVIIITVVIIAAAYLFYSKRKDRKASE
jgi:membrane protein DedA with SNARE-associated domain